MDTELLHIFIEVAHRGSFAAVARERNVDPSSVSRAIALLEDGLGIRLFQRTTRRMELTEAGEIYLSRVEPLVQDLGVARDDALAVSSSPRGTLRLTASVAFGTCCLVPLLSRFRAMFPELQLELVLSDANLDLVAERIDLAIRLGPSVEADVVGVKLFDTRYRVCATPEYVRTNRPLRAPRDLSEVPCLLYTFPDYRTRWLFRGRRGKITEVPVTGQILMSNALALRESTCRGLGPALLADWLVRDELRSGALVDLFPLYRVSATNFETAAWLLYPSRALLPQKVRATIDFLRAELRPSGIGRARE